MAQHRAEGGAEGIDLRFETLPAIGLLRAALILGGAHGKIVVGPNLEARLHDCKRLEKTAKLVTATDHDIVREITGRHTFGDPHCG